MATIDNNQTVQSSYNPNASSLNIYGSGADLSAAKAKYNGTKGVNFYDITDKSFNPDSVSNGVLLGGSAVTGNVNGIDLNKAGVQRIWGDTSADTNNALNNYMSSYGKPTSTPNYTPFSFNGDMQTYIDQAQGLLKPQKELAEQSINDNYDKNYIPQANNDTLSRGLARSSYAGNRVDDLNNARAKEITNADLQLQQQANNLAMQNYNTAYDRSYQGWKDTLANNWQQYNAADDSYWKDKNWNMQQDQFNWQQIKDKNDENWKKQNQANWQTQFDNDNSWKQKTFDYQKEQDALSNALKVSSGSGGSGGGRRSSGGSSGSGNMSKTQQKDRYSQAMDEALANGDSSKAEAMLYEDKQGVIDNLGYDYWKKLEDNYWNWMAEGY